MEKDELILNNTNLIYYVLQKLNLYNKQEELYDLGLIGLVKAANMFDISKGYKFSTYATKCIKNEILNYMRKHKKDFITDSLEEVKVYSDGDDILLKDLLQDDFDIDEYIIKSEQIDILNDAIMILKNDEKQLLQYYYLNNCRLSQRYIAKELNISQAHVSRKLDKIIRKLKKEVGYKRRFVSE